jgi:hypothetical protein
MRQQIGAGVCEGAGMVALKESAYGAASARRSAAPNRLVIDVTVA